MLGVTEGRQYFRSVIVESLVSRSKLACDCLNCFLSNKSTIESTQGIENALSLECELVEEVKFTAIISPFARLFIEIVSFCNLFR
jgi:hypothetical protein